MEYRKRIIDSELESRLEVFGAVLIVGPKGCGKTTTGKHFAKSVLELQDEDRRNQILNTAEVMPSKLLIGENPRLIDEWQDAPKLWGAVRKSVDDRQEKGLYILTGSTSQKVKTPHTGTMRITRLFMRPMSLFEMGCSNGEVSLKRLFEDPDGYGGCHSDLSIDDLIDAICIGGWPSTIGIESKKGKLSVAKDYLGQICSVDVSNIDEKKRNPVVCESIMRSYSRNICTLSETKTIMGDVTANVQVSKGTFYDYIGALQELFVIEDIDAWSPAIRSKSTIRAGKKRNLIDPSLAVASLKIGPEYFNTDFETLGFLFESLCIRDLRVYSHDGHVSYYHDRYGLEADVVLHNDDGGYALMEIKLGANQIDAASSNLNMIESLIKEHNTKNEKHPIPLPTFKAVITGTEYGYRREDGVLVIPIGCLRD